MVEKILVVDNDASLCNLVTRRLQDSEFEAHQAETGRKALAMLQRFDFEVVVLNHTLPDICGIEVLKRAKQLNYRGNFILLTDRETMHLAVQAVKAGAQEALAKPFKYEALAQLISFYCGKVRASSPAEEDGVVEYVRQNAHKIKSRQHVAKDLGISAVTVSNRISRNTGQTFQKFLHQCRLERARQLLEDTSLNICQIADRVGFNSPEVFARVFCKELGTKPTSYRLNSKRKKMQRVGSDL